MSHAKKLSLWRFHLLILMYIALLLVGMRIALPRVWHMQTQGGVMPILWVFLVMHLGNAFSEWAFHRYVLHAVSFRVARGMAEKHREHHRLTAIRLRTIGPNRFILNQYPITEPEQYVSSAFPWWALPGFWLFFTPLLVAVQLLLPRLPILLGGYAAVTWSMILYESLHAVEHWPYAWWKRRVEHGILGTAWKRFYAFHHMHHANVRCNEAIGGFFGLPIADWLFGTYYQPQDLLLEGQQATAKEFAIPKPARIVQWMDRIVRQREARIQRNAQ